MITVAAKQVSKSRVRVTIDLSVRVKRKTPIAFIAFPCRDATCGGKTSAQKTVHAGQKHLRFKGTVPLERDVHRHAFACIFGQAVDEGFSTDKRAYQLGGKSVCVRVTR